MRVDIKADSIGYRRKITRTTGLVSAAPSSVPADPAGPSEPSARKGEAAPWEDTSSADVLEQWNAALNRPGYAVGFVLGGVLVGAALSFLNPVWSLPAFVLALLLASFANRRDKQRRNFILEYHFDEVGHKRWTALNAALAALNKSALLWCVTPRDRTYDWKHHTGSSALVNRFRATLAQQPAPSLVSNVTPYCLRLGNQDLFFFPDRLYLYQNEKYEAIAYEDLDISTGNNLFMEEEGTPDDATVVGSSSQQADKNSGPARRGANSRPIPIVNYGVVELQSAPGLHLLLHVSSLNAAHHFGTLYQQSRTATTSPASQIE